MIEVRDLTKRYGTTVAVDRLSFSVQPGTVTGFLGPNGAGKSTTMRMILGLDRPTSGVALVDGHPYADSGVPLREVGALLDAKAVHGGRTARAHLRALAYANGLPAARVDEVLVTTGMSGVATRRIGGFSLGMSQRLGIAAALLGDPRTLLFDEPVNGLDPEGIVWIRTLMRALAEQGRTVLVSSHLMGEMALTADHLVVIGRGRLLADMPTQQFIEQNSVAKVRVRSPQLDHLEQLLRDRGASVERLADHLDLTGLDTAEVGELAASQGIVLHELATSRSSLEEAFVELTRAELEYHSVAPGSGVGERQPDQLAVTRSSLHTEQKG